MNEENRPPSLGELLRHAAWARHLSRALVGDAAADDIVQDAWVAALRRPPDTRQPLRLWLATVVRNKAFNRARDQARREAREARADARDAPESAESTLGRLEMHATLAEVVAELPEPYRQTVVLAYFDELTSTEIGERHHVPAGTVRGRLKTALDLLREALDRRLGSRAAWLVPVTNLARPPAPPPLARNAAPVGAGGGATHLAVTACAVAVIAVAAVAAARWSRARRPPAPPVTAAVTGLTTANAPAPPAAIAGRPDGTPHAGVRAAISGLVVAGGPEARRAGARRDADGGIAGAVVRVIGRVAAQPIPTTRTTTMPIVGGRFPLRVQLVPAGGPLVVPNDDDAPHLVRVALDTVELFKSAIPAHQRATVEVPGGAVILRLDVLDGASAPAFVATRENGFAAVTDTHGRFVLGRLPAGHYTLEAWDEALGTTTAELSVPPADPTLVFVFGSVPEEGLAAFGQRPCTTSTENDLPIAKVCAWGGQAGARMIMKGLVKQANARGASYTCDACHADVLTYRLKAHARDDLRKLLAIVATR